MLSTPANTLPKEERLCGKTTISALISGGRWGSTAHLKYCWRSTGEEGAGRIMVSVSKRYFKRAVKRNLLKRRLREAYRTQKQLLTAPGVDFMLVWTGKETADYETIRGEVATILGRISKAAAQR
jgi:ribonuclease P protein component